jgi:hypothetical protein
MITADITPPHAKSIRELIAGQNDPDAPPAGYTREHAHYFKDVSKLHEIDLYRVFDLWGVTHPCAQHAIKKLMAAGQRGVKDMERDVREAGDTVSRWLQMIAEDER